MLKNGFLFTIGAAGASLLMIGAAAATLFVIDKIGLIRVTY